VDGIEVMGKVVIAFDSGFQFGVGLNDTLEIICFGSWLASKVNMRFTMFARMFVLIDDVRSILRYVV